MVFVKGHQLPWNMREQLQLLQLYYSESDWPSRAGKMSKQFNEERGRGFFTPKSCQREFDRVMSLPCPGHESTASGRAGYSHKAVIEAWMKHLTEEIKKEDDRLEELDLVEIRRISAMVERLWNGKPPLNNREIRTMLEEAEQADAKRSDQEQAGLIFNAYVSRITEVMTGEKKTVVPGRSLPPTKASVQSPKGAQSAFRSPSPFSSPLKSPIRPVAEAIREAMSPKKQSEPPAPVEKQEEEQHMEVPPETIVVEEPVVELEKEVEKVRTPSPVKPPREPLKTPEKPTEKRGRGRPPKVVVPSLPPTPTAPSVTEEKESIETPPPKIEKEEKKKTKERGEADGIHVENSPAGRRGSRRGGVADSPLVSGRKRPRTAGIESSEEPVEPEEKKSRRSELKKESSVVSDVSPSLASSLASAPDRVAAGEAVSVSVQTEVSIRGSLWLPHEKKEKRHTPSRKSTRRSDVSEDSSQPFHHSMSQTGKVEFDRDDKIVLSWRPDVKPFVSTISIDSVEKKEDDWSDEDDLALANISKRSSAHSVPSHPTAEETEEKHSKKDSKRELKVVFETDDWLCRELGKLPNHKLLDGSAAASSSKRLRKEEKSKEDSGSQTKSLLLNAFRSIGEHRHSGIFAHPVNDKEAPGYSVAVKRRMDLHTLKREIETGAVTTPAQVKHKLLLMYANAIMFNSTGHDVNTFAKDMAKDTIEQLLRLTTDDRKAPILGHPRRSKVADEVTRSTRQSSQPHSFAHEFPEVGTSRALFGRNVKANIVRKLPS